MAALDTMSFGAETLTAALAWVLTYCLHSTALLGGAWILLRTCKRFSDGVRDGIWKVALVGGVVTATAQVGFGIRTFGGSLLLLTPETPLVEREERGVERETTPLRELELVPSRPDSTSVPASRSTPTNRTSGSTLAVPRMPMIFPHQFVQSERSSGQVERPDQRTERQVPSTTSAGALADSSDEPAQARDRAGTQLPREPFETRRARVSEPDQASAPDGAAVATRSTPRTNTARLPERSDRVASLEAAQTEAPQLAESFFRPPTPAAHPQAQPRSATSSAVDPRIRETERAPADLVARVDSPVDSEQKSIAGAAQLARSAGPKSLPASPWFLLPWLGGLVVGGLAIALALFRLRRALVRRTPLVEGQVAELFADLLRRAGTRRRVRLSTSADIAAPITFGVWRPEVCLPDRALVELDAEQQEAMLAHELAHAIRRDPMWQLLSKSLVAAFFFQPLNRLARKRILDLAEYLSDDWAVAHTGRELPLASCLTEVARWLVAGKKPLLAPGMADGSRLSSRVYRLLDKERSRSKRAVSSSSRVVLATTGLVAFAGFVPGITAAPLTLAPTRAAEDDRTEPELESVDAPLLERSAAQSPDRIEPAPTRGFGSLTDAVSSVPARPIARTSALMSSIQTALIALDEQIDDLQVELDSIREAIRGLEGVDELDLSVSLIEAQLTRLRDQREVLAEVLPRLADSPASDPRPSEEPEDLFNPRKLNR